jgi:hypothetical protein
MDGYADDLAAVIEALDLYRLTVQGEVGRVAIPFAHAIQGA